MSNTSPISNVDDLSDQLKVLNLGDCVNSNKIGFNYNQWTTPLKAIENMYFKKRNSIENKTNLQKPDRGENPSYSRFKDSLPVSSLHTFEEPQYAKYESIVADKFIGHESRYKTKSNVVSQIIDTPDCSNNPFENYSQSKNDFEIASAPNFEISTKVCENYEEADANEKTPPTHIKIITPFKKTVLVRLCPDEENDYSKKRGELLKCDKHLAKKEEKSLKCKNLFYDEPNFEKAEIDASDNLENNDGFRIGKTLFDQDDLLSAVCRSVNENSSKITLFSKRSSGRDIDESLFCEKSLTRSWDEDDFKDIAESIQKDLEVHPVVMVSNNESTSSNQIKKPVSNIDLPAVEKEYIKKKVKFCIEEMTVIPSVSDNSEPKKIAIDPEYVDSDDNSDFESVSSGIDVDECIIQAQNLDATALMESDNVIVECNCNSLAFLSANHISTIENDALTDCSSDFESISSDSVQVENEKVTETVTDLRLSLDENCVFFEKVEEESSSIDVLISSENVDSYRETDNVETNNGEIVSVETIQTEMSKTTTELVCSSVINLVHRISDVTMEVINNSTIEAVAESSNEAVSESKEETTSTRVNYHHFEAMTELYIEDNSPIQEVFGETFKSASRDINTIVHESRTDGLCSIFDQIDVACNEFMDESSQVRRVLDNILDTVTFSDELEHGHHFSIIEDNVSQETDPAAHMDDSLENHGDRSGVPNAKKASLVHPCVNQSDATVAVDSLSQQSERVLQPDKQCAIELGKLRTDTMAEVDPEISVLQPGHPKNETETIMNTSTVAFNSVQDEVSNQEVDEWLQKFTKDFTANEIKSVIELRPLSKNELYKRSHYQQIFNSAEDMKIGTTMNSEIDGEESGVQSHFSLTFNEKPVDVCEAPVLTSVSVTKHVNYEITDTQSKLVSSEDQCDILTFNNRGENLGEKLEFTQADFGENKLVEIMISEQYECQRQPTLLLPPGNKLVLNPEESIKIGSVENKQTDPLTTEQFADVEKPVLANNVAVEYALDETGQTDKFMDMVHAMSSNDFIETVKAVADNLVEDYDSSCTVASSFHIPLTTSTIVHQEPVAGDTIDACMNTLPLVAEAEDTAKSTSLRTDLLVVRNDVDVFHVNESQISEKTTSTYDNGDDRYDQDFNAEDSDYQQAVVEAPESFECLHVNDFVNNPGLGATLENIVRRQGDNPVHFVEDHPVTENSEFKISITNGDISRLPRSRPVEISNKGENSKLSSHLQELSPSKLMEQLVLTETEVEQSKKPGSTPSHMQNLCTIPDSGAGFSNQPSVTLMDLNTPGPSHREFCQPMPNENIFVIENEISNDALVPMIRLLVTPNRHRQKYSYSKRQSAVREELLETSFVRYEPSECPEKTRLVLDVPTSNLLDLSINQLENLADAPALAAPKLSVQEPLSGLININETILDSELEAAAVTTNLEMEYTPSKTDLYEEGKITAIQSKEITNLKKQLEHKTEECDKIIQISIALYENEKILKKKFEEAEHVFRKKCNEYEKFKDYVDRLICEMNKEREEILSKYEYSVTALKEIKQNAEKVHQHMT